MSGGMWVSQVLRRQYFNRNVNWKCLIYPNSKNGHWSLISFFQPKDYGVLSKYDEELEGETRKTFRLDESGEASQHASVIWIPLCYFVNETDCGSTRILRINELESEVIRWRRWFLICCSVQVDVEKDREAEEMRRRLLMAGKTLVSLDDSNKFNRASEFYTQVKWLWFNLVCITC